MSWKEFRERAKIVEESFAKIKVLDNKDQLIIDDKNAMNLRDDKKSIFINLQS